MFTAKIAKSGLAIFGLLAVLAEHRDQVSEGWRFDKSACARISFPFSSMLIHTLGTAAGLKRRQKKTMGDRYNGG
jgi:hypothetical protein